MSFSGSETTDSPVPFEGTESAVVMFVISKSIHQANTEADLYDMTRGNWRIGENSRQSAEIALGIADGIIQSAYRIDSWGHSSERYAPEVAKGLEKRSCFTGHTTLETDAWIGSSVRHLAPGQGAANPVRLFLNGVPSGVVPSRVTFAQQLAQEPLAQIMFGNKELFHSNMLAWIFNTFPDEADQVFGSFVGRGTGTGERRVEREKENLDLVFHWPDRDPLIIENKVFSVPSAEQLDAYAKKASKWDISPSMMLLLSPTRSGFIEGGYKTRYTNVAGRPLEWEHLSFERLAELLQLAFDVREAGHDTSYEVETVLRYSTVLLALGGLVNSTRIQSTDEQVFSASGDVDPFLTKQMLSGLSKARAERVAEGVNQRLVREGQVPTAYSLFSNALPGVSSFFDVQSGGHEFRAGWQYQQGQFRLALILPHLAGKGHESKNSRAAFARQSPQFFSFDHLDPILGCSDIPLSYNKQGKAEGEFNHFDPDFVYRYKKLPGLTIEQIMLAAVAHAEYLSSWA